MVEIEISVLSKQCLDRRIPNISALASEIQAWCKTRNESGARIRWLFDVTRARKKMGHTYPTPQTDQVSGLRPHREAARTHQNLCVEVLEALRLDDSTSLAPVALTVLLVLFRASARPSTSTTESYLLNRQSNRFF